MLFSSYEFILLFLPITLLVFTKIGSAGHYRVAHAWLVGASLFFYGWWNPAYLGLIVISMVFNYAVGVSLASNPDKRVLTFGIVVDLLVLGYFKYANFFVTSVNDVAGTDFHFDSVLLPLGISFFTFQKIAYLVDAYRGETKEYNFLQYALFVLFFPQLIAGPIVHHKDVVPQFMRNDTYRVRARNIAIGCTIFAIGLAKKVIIADNLAPYADMTFDAAAKGMTLTFFEAWRGALAYTFQLYFDFSGYSDMAIGLGAMFGIRLPLNFNSPYKATSIIDFWRRWHMTLSRFLLDYLYIPLGGNRRGTLRRYLNLMVTMLIGGLWHGAAWTFVVWGGMHGAFLAINHGWREWTAKSKWTLPAWFGRALTFMAVVFAWVVFRAENFSVATSVMAGMVGANGVLWPGSAADLGQLGAVLQQMGWQFAETTLFKGGGDLVIIALLLALVWKAPNTQEFMGRYHPVRHINTTRFRWRPSPAWALFFGALALLTLLQLSRVSAFLYFQF